MGHNTAVRKVLAEQARLLGRTPRIRVQVNSFEGFTAASWSYEKPSRSFTIARRYRTARQLDIAVGRLGVVFGRWEYDTGVRDTLSAPMQLLKVAEAGGVARFKRDLPDDWVYATDIATAVMSMLDASRLADEVYHLATGHRWSVPGWCRRLQSAYPSFSFEETDDPSRVTIGAAAPAARAPFSVARIKAATGFEARYDQAAAFEDYLQWHRHAAH